MSSQTIAQLNGGFKTDLPEMQGYILPDCPELLQQIHMASIALSSGIPVSIVGPSGSGKSMLAKYLHYICFKNQNLVVLNAAAICDSLADSELFGYEKGSFTGALQSKPSVFEQADSGVVFLDEITSMNRDIQAKLLRVIEEQKIKRVGATQEKSVNFALITATNISFQEAIDQKQFREDLYYRISGFQIQMPTIQGNQRVCQHYAQILINRYAKVFFCEDQQYLESLMRACVSKNWPGNLREMENFIKMSICMHQKSAAYALRFIQTIQVTRHEEAQMDIQLALKQFNYNITKVAATLNMSRSTLYRKMKGLGICV